VSNGQGAININVLWEMGGAQRILHGVLERTRGMVAGVTCGAGMPYKLSEIAASYGVSYLPIISSARAFSALWKRAYSKFADYLSAVVYEDPWLAGGHNGLSNAEDPLKPQDPYPRVKALRDSMRQGGISDDVPIVMAGGVWNLKEWNDWIDNPELGQIVFQFGTRPLLTQESPIPADWKARPDDAGGGRRPASPFSPTGFYSSAVRNLSCAAWRRVRIGRLHYQGTLGDHSFELDVGVGTKKNYWVTRGDLLHAREWYAQGYTEALKTPDETLVFVTPEEKTIIRKDQADCMGCLSQCAFSSWADNEKNSTGRSADPRSFCIQKTLQDIAHGGPSRRISCSPARGVPLQEGSLLLERVRADREAIGGTHPDRRLSRPKLNHFAQLRIEPPPPQGLIALLRGQRS
jgi:NAD(P)H-dependent flavin oxidoreductase YrpB (nitropropane dioxygenase family)